MRKGSMLLATGALALFGCKPKGNSAVATADSNAVAAPAATPAAPNVVTVHAVDFAFKSVPDSIPAGLTTFQLVNDGKVPHHMEVVRLDSGKTVADLQKELAKPAAPPAWVAFQGGPNAPDPGKTANATMDLQPGAYVMMCFVDMPGGVPHFAKGMIKPFTVTARNGVAATPPASDIAVKLVDYNFDLSKPLTAGSHTFEVSNAATQPHELELVRLAPGKTIDDLTKFMAKPAGPPPGELIGGVAPFSHTTNYFSANITPGNYALICFVPDAKDGKPHFMHGMTKSITVS